MYSEAVTLVYICGRGANGISTLLIEIPLRVRRALATSLIPTVR